MTGRAQEQRAQPPRSALRSDAEQNRARILEVARTALAESGEATLSSIAKLAGVGQGTMYRHFPTRETLLLAVYRQDVQAVIAAAPALLAAHPPDQALRLWFDRLASYGRIKRGLADAFEAATRADLSGEYYGQVTDAITLLLQACQRVGAVRQDVDADEVLLLVGFLWRLDHADWEIRSRHLLDLVMDGLRPAGHTPLQVFGRGLTRDRLVPPTTGSRPSGYAPLRSSAAGRRTASEMPLTAMAEVL